MFKLLKEKLKKICFSNITFPQSSECNKSYWIPQKIREKVTEKALLDFFFFFFAEMARRILGLSGKRLKMTIISLFKDLSKM